MNNVSLKKEENDKLLIIGYFIKCTCVNSMQNRHNYMQTHEFHMSLPLYNIYIYNGSN